MNVRTRTAAVVGAVLFLVGLGSAPASAEPNPALLVSNVKATPGELNFVLTGSGLPSPTELAAGKVTVSFDGTEFSTKIKDARSTPRTELPVRAVILAVDTGGSMKGAPLVAAEVALLDYVDALPPDVAVGLVAFSETAKTLLAPGYDRGALRGAIGALTASGPSALYDAVRLAAEQFESTVVERRIVLLTDGPDDGSKTTVAEAATALKNERAALDLVSYGPVDQGSDVAALATGTVGQPKRATTREELKTSLHDLVDLVPAPIAVTATVPPSLSGRSVNLSVSVVSGAKNLQTVVSVTFAVDPNAAPNFETVRLRVLPVIVFGAALGLVGLAIVIVGFVVVFLLLGRPAVRERKRQLERIGGKTAQAEEKRQEGSAVVRAALAASERVVQRQGRSDIEVGLDRAGIALRPAEWLLTRVAVAGVTAFIAALIVPWYLGLTCGAGIGWYLTTWYRKRRATKRATKFGDLLPDALQLVVGALRSGFSLMQAIDAVVREGPEPVSGEFGRAMAEIRLGGEIEAALERTAERNGSRDLAWLVMAIRIQREVGGNLSEVLETAVETMRERGRLARHVRALSAEGRLSAYVLVGMPIALSSWMTLFRGEYIRPLYTKPLGMVMLGAAVLMIVLGAFWISRLIKVKV